MPKHRRHMTARRWVHEKGFGDLWDSLPPWRKKALAKAIRQPASTEVLALAMRLEDRARSAHARWESARNAETFVADTLDRFKAMREALSKKPLSKGSTREVVR